MLKLLKSYNPLETVSGVSVISAFSIRASGNMSLSYGEVSRSLENRKSFLSSLSINYKDLVCAQQVHGSSVKYVNEANKGSGALDYGASIPDTDGFITDIKNLPLAIFTADCLPVFLYDPKRPAVGLIHAGWRSSKEQIIVKAISLMREKFDTHLSELMVGFGSCIRDCCYEVSAEFKDYFPDGTIERAGKQYLNLAVVNRGLLINQGIEQENIFDSAICTFCDTDFFSYRRQGKDCGRMISVIMLK